MKKSLFTAGVIALALVALIVAGSAAAFAQGGSTQSQCNPNVQKKCPSGPQVTGTQVKSPSASSGEPEAPSAGGTIISINGSTVTVQATVGKPTPTTTTSAIHLTANTTFQKITPPKQLSPASQADLAVGETIQAQGTLNSDGSLQAAVITILLISA